MAGIDLGDAWADNVWEENTWANGVWAGQENYPQGGGGGAAADQDVVRTGVNFTRLGSSFIASLVKSIVRRY